MRIFCLGLLAIALSGCSTKRNTDRCCTDPVDCQARGLPADSTCASGEVCRGDECVLLTCGGASDCDLTAPYCESGACAETCSMDEQCPGFGQTDAPFCVDGGCAECRVGMDDCGGRICDANACRACASDGECPTGLCGGDGRCAASTDVAFVHPAGSGTSMCTQSEPCTLFRALALTPSRTYLRFAPGLYQNTGTIELTGRRVLTGLPNDQVSITNTGAGPVFSVALQAEITLEMLKIFGATSGSGITCGAGKLEVFDSHITGNSGAGLASSCGTHVRDSLISANGGVGIGITGMDQASPSLVERTMVRSNTGRGLNLDGYVTARNVFVTGNMGGGVGLQDTVGAAPRIEFATIAANAGIGVYCYQGGAKPTIANSIVALHSTDIPASLPTNPDCLTATVITSGADLRFVSSTAEPFDYHLAPGSAAIDAASGTTATDFDGEARPKGAAADVGADEAF